MVPMSLGLLILFFMTFLGHGIIPFPITAYVIWLGQFGDPLWVIIVATLGNVLGWMVLEKYLAPFLERRPHWVAKIPAHYQQLFMLYPAVAIFSFNALPFPLDPMRFLATAYQYPRWKLWSAMAVGRFARYTLLVFIGVTLAPYQPIFWGVLALFLLMPLMWGKFWLRSGTALKEMPQQE